MTTFATPLLAASDSPVWDVIARNWALFSIILTIALLIVVPLLVLNKYVRICLNILKDTEPPLFMGQSGFVPLSGEDRDFHTADGIRLRATIVQTTAKRPKGFILFAPEFKSTRHSCARYCRPLLEAGYDIMTFDFRGHGDSANEEGYLPRQWASDREVTDIMTAIAIAEEWLEHRGRSIDMGLFGISRGAGAALMAAEHRENIRAIVTDGAFSSDCTLEHFLKRWASIFAKVRVVAENHPPEFWRFLRWWVFHRAERSFKCRFPSVRKALMRMLPRPILFIHGARDSHIPVNQSRLLYAQAAQPRYLWIVPGAKHNQSVDIAAEEYARQTVQFFDRYLADDRSPSNLYYGDLIEGIAASEREFHHISVDTEETDDGELLVGAGAGDEDFD
ncbi:MAG: alpha/beta hydrolase [Phycisphaerales bacterium]|nr:alpha/beta hydrolase [Phycisphaerales bacterium]MCB9856198.1 alpha/beta hydrolase [Phycisphaerales bacterium]MCB9863363.1 alpha/beta hydrolase [Phycisphaerales bacterium]